MRSVNIRLIKNTQDEGDKIMYEIMSADEAIRLIRDGDCICVNSFVGIENPTELHEAIYRRYQKMQSPTHLTIVSSAGFGVWDEEHNAERYIKETGFADETSLHFEMQDGQIIKEILNNGWGSPKSDTYNPLCDDCPFGFEEEKIDYSE